MFFIVMMMQFSTKSSFVDTYLVCDESAPYVTSTKFSTNLKYLIYILFPSFFSGTNSTSSRFTAKMKENTDRAHSNIGIFLFFLQLRVSIRWSDRAPSTCTSICFQKNNSKPRDAVRHDEYRQGLNSNVFLVNWGSSERGILILESAVNLACWWNISGPSCR